MMKEYQSKNVCPKCGAPVPAEAPQGLCPKCVLADAATEQEPAIPPASTSDIPSLARVAQAFPQLEILDLIGRGGMGFVFKARQPHLDRFVALKLLPDHLAKDPQFAERFNREGRVLARLSHPNIVSVYDFGRTEHFYYLLMEYVDGVNMRQAMRAGRFSPSEALTVVPKICEALQYAHEQGVLHRDIKPENILLDARGRVKIADFGIAKLVGEDAPHVTLTNTGSALGTPHYMAPEQLEEPGSVDHRADIYSLGVVFYEMLTGELPLGRFDPPSVKSQVDARIDDVVFRALERKREKRFQSAGEVRTSVDDIRNTPRPKAAAAPDERAPDPLQPSGPHGTMRLALPRSRKALVGALLSGISLLLVAGTLTLTFVTRARLGFAEMLIIGLPGSAAGLVGLILGWMALSDIREKRRRRQDLPAAAFAALAWPLFFLVLAGMGIMALAWRPVMRMDGLLHRFGLGAILGVVALGILLILWITQTVSRWATGETASHQRGILRGAFLTCLILAAGFGIYNYFSPGNRLLPDWPSGHTTSRPRPPKPPQPPLPRPVLPKAQDIHEAIRVTVHEVGMQQDEGTNWLVIHYARQQRRESSAELRLSFPWKSEGYRATMQTLERYVSEDQHYAEIHSQVARWSMPENLDPETARSAASSLTRALAGKSVEVELNQQKPWFEASFGEHGSLRAALQVKPATEPPSVQMHFTKADLLEDKGEAWISVAYRRGPWSGDLALRTEGAFPETSIELRSHTEIAEESPGGPSVTEHRISLRLPKSMDASAREDLRRHVAETWQQQSLTLYAGDEHILFTVPTSDGRSVRVVLEGQEPEPKP